MRLFIAMEIEDSMRERCKELIKSLRESGADIKTVSPENLHITLKFLGEVREDYVKKISDTIDELSGELRPFRLGFSVMGYFGSTSFPRVIWIGISEGRDTVSNIAGELNKRLSWVMEEHKKPRPHLTLARVRSPRNSEKLVETIQSLRDVKLGEFDVKEIRLKKSVLKPDGPVYSDLATFSLGKKEK